jgi:hypothetical protein
LLWGFFVTGIKVYISGEPQGACTRIGVTNG